MCEIKRCETCNNCKIDEFQVPGDSKCKTHYTAYCTFTGNFLAINFRKSEPLPIPKNCLIAVLSDSN